MFVLHETLDNKQCLRLSTLSDMLVSNRYTIFELGRVIRTPHSRHQLFVQVSNAALCLRRCILKQLHKLLPMPLELQLPFSNKDP